VGPGSLLPRPETTTTVPPWPTPARPTPTETSAGTPAIPVRTTRGTTRTETTCAPVRLTAPKTGDNDNCPTVANGPPNRRHGTADACDPCRAIRRRSGRRRGCGRRVQSSFDRRPRPALIAN
jgi:hypothetical protein